MNAKDTLTLKVQKREEKGRKMRAVAGTKIPAVVYGSSSPVENLWVETLDFSRAFAQAGTNTVVSLAIDGAKPLNVLVYDYQTDPVSNVFTHIDFYVVDMTVEVEAEIPLSFVGVSAAMKELGGTLVKNSDTLEVRALPGNLPHEIEVDLTKLATFDDMILVSDIAVNKNVAVIPESDTVIALVVEPRSEEEMAALDEEVDADVSKIEGVADKDEDENEEASDKDDEKKA